MDTLAAHPGTHLGEFASYRYLRRIMVVGCATLLEEGLMRLLDTRHTLEVFQVDDNEADRLAFRAAQIQPDVIILCHIDQGLLTRLVPLLDCIPTIADMMIINVDLESKDLNVYQHDHWFSADQSAFFALVNGKNGGLSAGFGLG